MREAHYAGGPYTTVPFMREADYVDMDTARTASSAWLGLPAPDHGKISFLFLFLFLSLFLFSLLYNYGTKLLENEFDHIDRLPFKSSQLSSISVHFLHVTSHERECN